LLYWAGYVEPISRHIVKPGDLRSYPLPSNFNTKATSITHHIVEVVRHAAGGSTT
jgi:hypothetical protein